MACVRASVCAPERCHPPPCAAQALLRNHDFYRSCMAAEELQLKHGAQVMLLVNLDLSGDASSMLANGRRVNAQRRCWRTARPHNMPCIASSR